MPFAAGKVDALTKALETVLKHKNHPGILMWSIWNDAPWIWDSAGSPFDRYPSDQIHGFLKKLFQEIKKSDPYHPITASNVLGHKGSDVGYDFLDVIGFNAYLGGIGGYVQEDADIDMTKLISIQNKFRKPVIILEMGFSTFTTGIDQGDILRRQIRTVGENLAGVGIFQWADGWNKAGFPQVQNEDIEEHWGVLTGKREPKSGYEALKEMYGAIPDESSGYIRSDL